MRRNNRLHPVEVIGVGSKRTLLIRVQPIKSHILHGTCPGSVIKSIDYAAVGRHTSPDCLLIFRSITIDRHTILKELLTIFQNILGDVAKVDVEVAPLPFRTFVCIDERVQQPEFYVLNVGRLEVCHVQLTHHSPETLLRIIELALGIEIRVKVVRTTLVGIISHVQYRACRSLAHRCLTIRKYLFLIYLTHIVVGELVKVIAQVVWLDGRILAHHHRVDVVPRHQGAVFAIIDVVAERRFGESRGLRDTRQHPVGRLADVYANLGGFEVIDVGRVVLYAAHLAWYQVGELCRQVDRRFRRGTHSRQPRDEVGQELRFVLPRHVESPQGVGDRLVTHVDLGRERLLAEVHDCAAELEVLGEVVGEVEPHHRLALHRERRVVLAIDTDGSASIKYALVQDCHYAHRVIDSVVNILSQRHTARRHHDRPLRDIHRTETYLCARRRLVFTPEYKFIFLRSLLGYRLGGVIEFLEDVFISYRVIANLGTEIRPEWLYHREDYLPRLRNDRVALDVIEETVGVGLVLVVEAVKVEDAEEDLLVYLPFWYII